MTKFSKYFSLAIAVVILTACGGKKFSKSPVDEMIRDMTNVPVYSVILYDMDAEGIVFTTYKHQYRIIKEEQEGKPEEEITGWKEVGERFFKQNENNMGMEIVSKTADGKLIKSASPAGYNNYIGNERYGNWQTNSSGNSFWAFYGQYAFMSSMFNMMAYPVRRSYYNNYRGSYYGTGRSYYGPRTSGGGRYYGTNSNYNRTSRPNSRWNNNFRNRVRSASTRSSKSGSRYKSGSSFRSRGGGFGK